MKQLEFPFSFGGHKTPSFEEWYHENSAEKRKFGETEYTIDEGRKVYNNLVETGFFERGHYNA